MKAIINISLFCHRKNIKFIYDGSQVIKLKANFILDKNAQLVIYQELKSMYIPDGHASNISRLLN
jgi:hypothetical protein